MHVAFLLINIHYGFISIYVMKKKIIVVTGPQSSGNHPFAKIFSSHPEVGGWKSFLDKEWEGHHHEPFAKYWQTPEELSLEQFEGYNFWAASVSTPYVSKGQVLVPKVREFCDRCHALGLEVTIVVISRDENITANIQNRVRHRVTIDLTKELVEDLVSNASYPIHFVSLEGLSLYRETYIKHLGKLLCFPIQENEDAYHYNTNKNYIHQIEKGEFDDLIRHAIAESVEY